MLPSFARSSHSGSHFLNLFCCNQALVIVYPLWPLKIKSQRC